MNTEQNNIVRRLRTAALAEGFYLRKNLRRNKTAPDYGRYRFYVASTHKEAPGNGPLGLTFDELEGALYRLGQTPQPQPSKSISTESTMWAELLLFSDIEEFGVTP